MTTTHKLHRTTGWPKKVFSISAPTIPDSEHYHKILSLCRSKAKDSMDYTVSCLSQRVCTNYPDQEFMSPEFLRSLYAAQPFQRLRNLSRPLRHLVVAQRALARLKLSPQQDRVLARANFVAAENFHRNKTAQLGDAQCANALINFRKLHPVVKHKGEVALDGREAGQRFIAHLPQIMLV